MSAHFAIMTARKDLRRRLADPAALLIWLALPLAIGSLLVLINSGDGGTPRGRLLVVDEDRSFVSGVIAAIPARGEMAELFDVVPVERAEGRRLIDAGEATALLILPAGLQGAFVGKGNAEIRLVTNPAQRILPSVIEETLKIAVDSAVYSERLLGRAAPDFADLHLDDATAWPSDIEESLSQLVRRLNSRLLASGKRVLAPPVLSVELAPAPGESESSGETAVADVGRIFLPGMIFLSVLFVAQGMSGDVWNEKRLGTLHRVASSPPSMAAFLAGKLLAGTSVAALVAVIGVAAGIVLFDLSLARAPLAVLWVAFSGGVMLVYFVLLQCLASSQRAGDMLSNLVLFPVLMLGGSFFPLRMMPDWMAEIGRRTPNGAALIRLGEILDAQPDFPAMALAALAIGIPAAIAFALATRRLSGRFLVS